MTSKTFSSIASSFPDTEEAMHFERKAYKVTGKRIFATLDEKSGTANLKLSVVDQSVFSGYGKGGIFPVNNKWGLQGWTTFELAKLPEGIVRDALETAYREVFKKRGKKD